MKCKICNRKTKIIPYCETCKNLCKENLKTLKTIAEEALTTKNYEHYNSFLTEFQKIYAKDSTLLNKIWDFIYEDSFQPYFDYKYLYFSKSSLHFWVKKLIIEKYKELKDDKNFRYSDIINLAQNFQININDNILPGLSQFITHRSKTMLSNYLNDEITLQEFLQWKDEFYKTIEEEHEGEHFDLCINSVVNKMLEDYIINDEEEIKLEKIFAINDNLKDAIKSSEKFILSKIMTSIIKTGKSTEIMNCNSFMIDNDDEVLFYEDDTEFSKMCTKTKIRSSGMGASIKICKGVYIRPSSITSEPVTYEYLNKIANGKFIITKDCIIFDGDNYSNKIDIKNLLNIKVWNEGLDFLLNNRENSIFFKFENPKFVYSLIYWLKNNNRL